MYIGSTANLKHRLSFHNSGKVKSTKAYCPWKLLESRRCDSRSEAVRLEKFLKTGQQKKILKNKYGAVAK